MTLPKSAGACVLLLLISTHALAQSTPASFEQLIAADALRPNQTVYVTDAWGERVKGRLGGIRSGSLVLIQGARRIRIAEADITRIQRGDSLQDGLWMGVGAGIAAGWIATHQICDLPDDECATIVFAAIGLPSMAAGAVTGALVDAAIRKTVFRFDGPRGSARIQVAPMIGGGQAGALAAIRF